MILDNTTHVVHVLWLLMHVELINLFVWLCSYIVIGGLSTNRFCLVFSLIWTGYKHMYECMTLL